jgi:hypothetical protein
MSPGLFLCRFFLTALPSTDGNTVTDGNAVTDRNAVTDGNVAIGAHRRRRHHDNPAAYDLIYQRKPAPARHHTWIPSSDSIWHSIT